VGTILAGSIVGILPPLVFRRIIDGHAVPRRDMAGVDRLALLALLLAEAETIGDRTGVPPLLLLDDVLSELDPGRRRILAARVRSAGQALVTATDPTLLPAAPDQLLEVTPGTVLEAVA
jgi:recombinational DNA repair ATPase RecF